MLPDPGRGHHDRSEVEAVAHRGQSLVELRHGQPTRQERQVRPDLGHVHPAQHVNEAKEEVSKEMHRVVIFNFVELVGPSVNEQTSSPAASTRKLL